YKITEGPIAEATLRKEMEAYKVVFENADTFKEVAVDSAAAAKVMTDGGFPDEINKAFEAVDANGNSLGYVVQLTTKDGYSGGIVMVVGITADGTVNGFSVTAHSETSGLGTKAFEPAYADQFKGIPAADVSGVATISGATLTSTAVINGINAAVAYANSLGGAQ
ncbi:MAG: FMN-binding protein, partial [Agathobacter sp.]|nr:FMN-binding protein [Agathobacter sp.]